MRLQHGNAQFLNRHEFWKEIATRLPRSKSVRVAVAYFSKGGAARLPLRKGDILIVDMSHTTVRQGATDPREIRKLFGIPG